jgi:hypothetical protein
MCSKFQLIRDSISDILSTIRVADAKATVLLAIILTPLSSLGRISAHLENVRNVDLANCNLIVILAFILSWLFALISAIKVISAVNNPACHVVTNNKCNGIFYSGGLFEFGIFDVFFNRNSVKASRNLHSQIVAFPDSEENIFSELVFEQLKLIYIRDIKLYRLNVCIILIYVWFFIGLAIYCLSKFFS